MSSYLKLCTEFYDLDKPQPPEPAFRFILSYAERAAGPILEPMCGSGSYLIPLSQSGFVVDGTDASPFMLDACRRRAQALALEPKLYEQRLARTSLPRRYALALIPTGSIGLITNPDELSASLVALGAALLPGAKLLIQVDTPPPAPSGGSPWGGRWLRREDGATLILSWLSHYDAAERVSRSIHRYELVKDGRVVETEVEHFDRRFFEREEFAGLLQAAGFANVRCLRAYGDEPPAPDDREVVFECERPADN